MAATDLLARFVAAFRRGIEGEVTAMRASAETFELSLTRGEDLGAMRYGFELAAQTDRLAAATICVLRAARGEQTVTIERVDGTRVVLVATQPIDLTAPAALVVAPWFLYERLLAALDAVDAAASDLALMLFGKAPHARTATALHGDHGALDPSQRAAVQLCSDSTLAFVWGPPGTGKTVTLTHVIEELLAQGRRILLVSTTNAAIDQVLAKVHGRPWFDRLVRLGRSDAETYGAELGDIVDRLHDAHRSSRSRLRARIAEVEHQLRYARGLIEELAPAISPQRSLFAEPPRLRPAALAAFAPAVAELAPRDQMRVIEQRCARLERVRTLAKARVVAQAAADRDLETRVVGEAQVVTCTLTTAYLSPALAGQQFDVLIAEEAGMATLPALFHAASRCRERAIMVGDPRQLPPIVQSDDDRVRRAIGRNIFELAPRPDVVAMLEVQYRMHPAIGALVGRLFYGDRLVHSADPAATCAIAARAPFPGAAVTVVDTAGRTTCQRSPKGSSRCNPGSAELTADLALEAVRGGAASVAVITPYAAQAGELRRLLAARRIGDAVECATIHRFQGRECDVVLLDLVDAAPLRPSALLGDTPNLLNVSISRARGKLVLIADVAYFRAAEPDGVVATLLRAALSIRDNPVHERANPL